MNPTTSNDAGSTTSDFRYYPADQAIGIIRAIAEHRWPMTVEEAFSLRDQFGWTPAPDDGRFFVTPVSKVETLSWYLPSRASVGLGVGTRFVSATIESPAMTDLTEAEEKYFAEGGEL